jgi:DNA recombination protein RmuC
MSNILPFLLIFIVALAIGIFIGKLLFSARFQSEKISLEEKLIAFSDQFNSQREQFSNDKIAFEKQLASANTEKEIIRNEKDSLAIQLSKKKSILRIFGNATKNRKKKSKNYRKNSPKNLRILPIKY